MDHISNFICMLFKTEENFPMEIGFFPNLGNLIWDLLEHHYEKKKMVSRSKYVTYVCIYTQKYMCMCINLWNTIRTTHKLTLALL